MPSYLTSVSGSSTSNSYTYDRYGNRTQQTSSPSGPNPSFSFNPANNRMVGGYYDAAGNITGDGIHSYTYDAEGNVLTADSTSYAYDAMNRRVASSNGTANVGYGTAAEFLYDPFGHRTSTWITSINFGNEGRIYWGNQQIAYRAFNGQTFFEHQDWLGTERMRTNYQGQVAAKTTSLAFGDGYMQNVLLTNGDQDNLHFAGLDHDTESNTDHAQFRQYSPTQGRWMSPDPYDGSYDPTNPQSMNRYAYVLNNPLSLVDPLGLEVTIGACTYAQTVTNSVLLDSDGNAVGGNDGSSGLVLISCGGTSSSGSPGGSGPAKGTPSAPSKGLPVPIIPPGMNAAAQAAKAAARGRPSVTPRNIPTNLPGPAPGYPPANEPPGPGMGRYLYYLMQILRIIDNAPNPIFPVMVAPPVPSRPICNAPDPSSCQV